MLSIYLSNIKMFSDLIDENGEGRIKGFIICPGCENIMLYMVTDLSSGDPYSRKDFRTRDWEIPRHRFEQDCPFCGRTFTESDARPVNRRESDFF